MKQHAMNYNKTLFLSLFIIISLFFGLSPKVKASSPKRQISLGLEDSKEPSNYNIQVRGFPAGQDVFLIQDAPYSQLWIKTKGWVKSVVLFAFKDGAYYPLVSLKKLDLQTDNNLFINGNLDSKTPYLASSASINLPATGEVFKIYLPSVVGYGDKPSVQSDLLSHYGKIFIRLYTQTFGRGKFVDIPYYIKDKLGANKSPRLKKLSTKEKSTYALSAYEYRGNTLNINGIRLSEVNKNSYTVIPLDLIKTLKEKLTVKTDGIKLVQWVYDQDTSQTVIRFIVLLRKQKQIREVKVSVIDKDGNALYSSQKVQALKPHRTALADDEKMRRVDIDQNDNISDQKADQK
jgi:hypothetical protein